MEGGHWPVLDKLLREGEGYAKMRTDTRAQANLLFALGNPDHGYWHLGEDHQLQVLGRTMALVPRLGSAPEPRVTLEAMFRLWLVPDTFEALSRAVKVGAYEPRPPQAEEPVYPTDGFTNWFTEWSRECDVPVGYMFWAGVAAIGAACRYNFFIDRGTEPMRMNQYLLFVGTKGTGKSTALDACSEVLRHMNGQVFGWKPGTELPNIRGTHPFHVKFLPEDTNQETLVRVLAPQTIPLSSFTHHKTTMVKDPHITESTGLLALDELSTFLGHGNWAVEKRVPWLNRIFADKPYTYHTQKGGTINLMENAVSLLACCPPDIMQSAVSPLLFQGGFLDRIIVVYRDPIPEPERLFPTPRPRDPLMAAQLGRYLLHLSARFHREELVATPEAAEWYEHWYTRQHDPKEPREQSIPRRANHLWKLAGTLAIGDESAPRIHLKHFQQAARVLDHEAFHYHRLLGVFEETPESALMTYIEQVLYRAGAVEGTDKHMLRSDLFQVLRNKRGLSPPLMKAKPMLDSLEAQDRVVRLVGVRLGGKVGRIGEAYQITQATAAGFKQRTRSDPQDSTVLHLPVPQRPLETEAPEAEAADTAVEPAEEQGQG